MGLITSRALRYESWVFVGEVEFGWSCSRSLVGLKVGRQASMDPSRQ